MIDSTNFSPILAVGLCVEISKSSNDGSFNPAAISTGVKPRPSLASSSSGFSSEIRRADSISPRRIARMRADLDPIFVSEPALRSKSTAAEFL